MYELAQPSLFTGGTGIAVSGQIKYHELKDELEAITAHTCKYTHTPSKTNIHTIHPQQPR